VNESERNGQELPGEQMYRAVYFEIQQLLDEVLGTGKDDGAGEGIVADVRLALERARQRGGASALRGLADRLQAAGLLTLTSAPFTLRLEAKRIEYGETPSMTADAETGMIDGVVELPDDPNEEQELK
jgi:hypothetical protein